MFLFTKSVCKPLCFVFLFFFVWQFTASKMCTKFVRNYRFFVCQSHRAFPQASGKCERFLEAVTRSTAKLVADWQCVGFVHGVLNTDNMSVLGLTIDYGPYGFLDRYDPDYIFNGSGMSWVVLVKGRIHADCWVKEILSILKL